LSLDWLTPRYGEHVAWLAEQHVAAERYLVTTDPAYVEAPSPVSRQTLIGQGGAMSPQEIRASEANSDHPIAVELRRFDDQAKMEHLSVPGIEAYRPILLAVAAEHAL
jgi:predicted HD phosphohydrolase